MYWKDAMREAFGRSNDKITHSNGVTLECVEPSIYEITVGSATQTAYGVGQVTAVLESVGADDQQWSAK